MDERRVTGENPSYQEDLFTVMTCWRRILGDASMLTVDLYTVE